MNVQKIITTSEPVEFNIDGITLLSTEEYEEYKDHIPLLRKFWWLRSPGHCGYFAAIVHYDGYVHYYGDNVMLRTGVRPALIYKSSNLTIGDKIEFAGYKWTVLSDKFILCDTLIGNRCFRENQEAEDANDYEKSDVKPFIEDWLKKHMNGESGKNEALTAAKIQGEQL